VIVKTAFVKPFSQMTRKLSFVPRSAALSASPATSGSFRKPSMDYNEALANTGTTNYVQQCVRLVSPPAHIMIPVSLPTGFIINGQPPLYLGIYANNFIYFLPPTKPEKKTVYLLFIKLPKSHPTSLTTV
jgi:hypothetical protein